MNDSKRTYKVVDSQTAKSMGAKTFSTDSFPFALIAVKNEKLDTMICWGCSKESLQNQADKRNNQIAMLQRNVNDSLKKLDNPDVNEVKASFPMSGKSLSVGFSLKTMGTKLKEE